MESTEKKQENLKEKLEGILCEDCQTIQAFKKQRTNYHQMLQGISEAMRGFFDDRNRRAHGGESFEQSQIRQLCDLQKFQSFSTEFLIYSQAILRINIEEKLALQKHSKKKCSQPPEKTAFERREGWDELDHQVWRVLHETIDKKPESRPECDNCYARYRNPKIQSYCLDCDTCKSAYHAKIQCLNPKCCECRKIKILAPNLFCDCKTQSESDFPKEK